MYIFLFKIIIIDLLVSCGKKNMIKKKRKYKVEEAEKRGNFDCTGLGEKGKKQICHILGNI